MEKQFLTVIAPGSISKGPIPFDLYTPLGGRLILFCRAGFSITDHHKQILDRVGRPFYISSDQMDSYVDYTFEKIEEIIASSEIRACDKAQIVHRVGKRTVHKLMDNPRSGRIVGQTGRVVENYVELILGSDEAASHLFALSALDAYIFSHSVNVCTFCLLLGQNLHGADREKLWELGMAGLTHDIGKTRIDSEILHKSGPLTEAETKLVREHPKYSFVLLREHGLSEAVQETGYAHHERMDGSGYPRGLKGDRIHHSARLCAVCDVYDAITSDRIYKPGKPHIYALQEMADEEKGYDWDCFEALLCVVLRHEKLVDNFLAEHLHRARAEEQRNNHEAQSHGGGGMKLSSTKL